MQTPTRAPAGAAVDHETSSAVQPTGSPAEQQVLRLQQGAGNASVARLLQRWTGAAAAALAVANEWKAREVFSRGALAYESGHTAHAYDFFRRAYELDARPGLLFSAAQALRREGGRRQEAIALYEQYLAAEGGTRKEEAQRYLDELRGPEVTGYAPVDEAAGRELFDKAAADYQAGRFGHAYDRFMKAYELNNRPGMLFSAAQALRRLGGRREEAIGLFELYLAQEGGTRKEEAQRYLDELREFGASAPSF